MSFSVNREFEPGYAGLATFCRCPLALTSDQLAKADVAVLGAPFDDGVSNRPGARFGPRAIRSIDNYSGPPSRPHLRALIDPFSVLSVVDYGDAECVPGDIERSHAAISDRVGEILAANALPIVLGGDHSIAFPHIAAVAETIGRGELGVIQFDTHADTAENVLDAAPHGVQMRRLVDGGFVDPTRFVQIGLRGCWPGPDEFQWMSDVGMHWHTMYEIDETGWDAVVSAALSVAGDGPVTISLDIDVLDPAYAPGTGTPEPGGLTTRELFRMIRKVSSRVKIASMEVVEVSPPFDVSGITALAAQRAVIEALVGIATRS